MLKHRIPTIQPRIQRMALYARIPFLHDLYFYSIPTLLFSFVRSRLTWDPAARERGSRADIDSGRGSACCCREIDRWNSAERARRRWGLTTPIVAAERAWALARLITSERPFDDHDRPTRRTRDGESDRESKRRRRQHKRASIYDRSDHERRREHRLRGPTGMKGLVIPMRYAATIMYQRQ